MTKLELIELIALGVIVLVLTIYYLIKALKNGWISKITDTVNSSIKYAEQNFTNGSEKKRYVMQKVEDKCCELGIPYGFIKKLVDKIIDKVVANYNVIKK